MKTKLILILALSVTFISSANSQAISAALIKDADDFFRKNVMNGRVDYAAIKKSPAELTKLIESISNMDWTKLQTGNEEKAFLINVYNLLVIKAVIDHYPLKSVMDIGGFFDKNIITIAGESYSLNEIEKEILFAKYPDPRLHFVLVCAAIGCPQIIPKVYTADQLENDLDQRTRITLNDSHYIRVDNKSKIVHISELFKWYERDFEDNDLSIIQYINQYRQNQIPEGYTISYITYDWTLNDIPKKSSGSILPERENLQAYTPSTLLKPGQVEIKIFNNLYTQTAFFDEERQKQEQDERSTYYTGIINFLYGVTQNLDIGFDIFIKSVYIDTTRGSPFAIFKFESGLNSRSALAQIGPKVKISPFKSIRNLAIQSVVLFPLASDLDGSDAADAPFLDVDGGQWWTQIFYDYAISNNFLLFFDTGLFIRFGSPFDDFFTPLKIFLNYFPSNRWTVYFMNEFNAFWKDSSVSAYYNQLGFGAKYQVSSNFELELLYTNFIFGKSQGAGETYNLGLRIII
jgi:hypothetical protein